MIIVRTQLTNDGDRTVTLATHPCSDQDEACEYAADKAQEVALLMGLDRDRVIVTSDGWVVLLPDSDFSLEFTYETEGGEDPITAAAMSDPYECDCGYAHEGHLSGCPALNDPNYGN